jgi:hypothetical protein
MIVNVVVGRTEGFVSSVGFKVNGLTFLCRGRQFQGLHWAPKSERIQAAQELREVVEHLRDGGATIEGAELLDDPDLRNSPS